jgi:hypothetical protein
MRYQNRSKGIITCNSSPRAKYSFTSEPDKLTEGEYERVAGNIIRILKAVSVGRAFPLSKHKVILGKYCANSQETGNR